MFFRSYKNTEQQKKFMKTAKKQESKHDRKKYKNFFEKNEPFPFAIRIRIQDKKNGGRKSLKQRGSG